MPSFFSKVFGRKKDDKEPPAAHHRRHSTSGTLLEGKYEEVSPTASPTAEKFSEVVHQAKEKEKDAGFSLFRPRSRTTGSNANSGKPLLSIPHLELNLSAPKETKDHASGVELEGADGRSSLPEGVIRERRLSPQETHSLVKACAAAIVNRGGLETLGVMHPHWYSASQETQRQLISLFILSLTPSTPTPSLSPSDSPANIFNSELSYTRSPHDIASVLRWALRHLRLDGPSFGSGAGGEDIWRWYTSFAEAERSAGYPPNAFSQSLVPSLPPPHLELLSATVDIISSLAAHAETNGSSGSKLTKFLGVWLLTTQRAFETDDWSTFYDRWERAGRILEHLFLSYIRDEAEKKKMPRRLSELVRHYPYVTGKEQYEDGLLPRPRISTRRYDALFVRISTELPSSKTPKPKQHPSQLVLRAFGAEVTASTDYGIVWEELKKVAASHPSKPQEEGSDDSDRFTLSAVFDDDTLRLFALVPTELEDYNGAPVASRSGPVERRPGRRRSASLPGVHTNGTSAKAKNGTTHTAVSPPTSALSSPTTPTDWSDFSTAGFGETSLGKDFAATLFDNDDVERTVPPPSGPLKRKSTSRRRRATSPSAGRLSTDDSHSPNQRPGTSVDILKGATTQTSAISLVELDEAFVDFWSDALTDPFVTSSWPSFVLCHIKSGVTLDPTLTDGKSINWLVIEHAFTYPPPPPPAEPTSPTSSKRPSSPRPSVRSSLSARKSTSRNRFSFFSGGTDTKGFSLKTPGRKRTAKSPVGEMGEVLAEVDEHPAPAVPATASTSGQGTSGNETATKVAPTSTPPVPVITPESSAGQEKKSATLTPTSSPPVSPKTPFFGATLAEFPPVPGTGGSAAATQPGNGPAATPKVPEGSTAAGVTSEPIATQDVSTPPAAPATATASSESLQEEDRSQDDGSLPQSVEEPDVDASSGSAQPEDQPAHVPESAGTPVSDPVTEDETESPAVPSDPPPPRTDVNDDEDDSPAMTAATSTPQLEPAVLAPSQTEEPGPTGTDNGDSTTPLSTSISEPEPEQDTTTMMKDDDDVPPQPDGNDTIINADNHPTPEEVVTSASQGEPEET